MFPKVCKSRFYYFCYGEMENDGSLKAVVSESFHELDKAKRILDRQAKAGVAAIPYYAETYPRHFRNLGMDAPPLIHVLGNEEQLNREDNVAIIGALAADKEGLNMAYRIAYQLGRQGHVVISGTMYAVRFAQKYDGDCFGWENDIYAIQYDTQNELNSGNKFLLESNLAIPINPNQKVTLGQQNQLILINKQS